MYYNDEVTVNAVYNPSRKVQMKHVKGIQYPAFCWGDFFRKHSTLRHVTAYLTETISYMYHHFQQSCCVYLCQHCLVWGVQSPRQSSGKPCTITTPQ